MSVLAPDLEERYRPVRKLGEGASGIVVLAQEVSLGRPVAVKLLTSADPNFRARVCREVELLREHPHPAIVPLLEADLEREPPFLVFPFVGGGDLVRFLEAGEPMDPEAVVEVARRIGSALAHLHARGVLHRDVKPHNILMEDGGDAFLADLGLGKGDDQATLTETGLIMGSIRYLAPEVILGTHDPSPSSDLYALAVTLAELARGERANPEIGGAPFTQEELAAIEPPKLRGALRASLRMLPEDRPGSMEAFLELLADGEAAEASHQDLPTATMTMETGFVGPSEAPPGPAPVRSGRGRRAGPALAVTAGLLVTGFLLHGLTVPAPPAPSSPPEPPAPTGSPLRPTARLLPAGELRLDLTRPVRAWWEDAPGTTVRLPAGETSMELPAAIGDELALHWEDAAGSGTRRWSTRDLLEYLLAPLLTPSEKDLLALARTRPPSPEVERAREILAVLSSIGPRLLDGAASVALKRRTLAGIERGEAALSAAGIGGAHYPRGATGSHRAAPYMKGTPPDHVLGEGLLTQPTRAPVQFDLQGYPGYGGFNVASRSHFEKTVEMPWRQLRERLLLVWPPPFGEPTGALRIRSVGKGDYVGARIGVHRRGSLRDPGECLFHLGGTDVTPPGADRPMAAEAVIPAELVPAPGEELELRVQALLGQRTATVLIHSLELTWVRP